LRFGSGLISGSIGSRPGGRSYRYFTDDGPMAGTEARPTEACLLFYIHFDDGQLTQVFEPKKGFLSFLLLGIILC